MLAAYRRTLHNTMPCPADGPGRRKSARRLETPTRPSSGELRSGSEESRRPERSVDASMTPSVAGLSMPRPGTDGGSFRLGGGGGAVSSSHLRFPDFGGMMPPLGRSATRRRHRAAAVASAAAIAAAGAAPEAASGRPRSLNSLSAATSRSMSAKSLQRRRDAQDAPIGRSIVDRRDRPADDRQLDTDRSNSTSPRVGSSGDDGPHAGSPAPSSGATASSPGMASGVALPSPPRGPSQTRRGLEGECMRRAMTLGHPSSTSPPTNVRRQARQPDRGRGCPARRTPAKRDGGRRNGAGRSCGTDASAIAPDMQDAALSGATHL